MKHIRINAGYTGLVFKKGDYQRVISQGKHWLKFGENVIKYNMHSPFNAPIALDILLKDKILANKLTIIDVADDELVLMYENNILKTVLTAGRHTYWNDFANYKFVTADISKIEITEDINKSLYKKVELSKYIRVFEVAGQELLTKDKAGIRINFYAQYKVTDIEMALMKNKDYEKQLYTILQLALRAFVGSYTLDELLDSKEAIAKAVMDDIKDQVTKLGIVVLHTGIRDVILPGDMKEIMNQVLIAQKKAQANVIMRREETASTRSLLNTAKLMDDNDMLFKLKEMEYVEKIADKIGEITVAGNGNVIKQLKDIFSVNK